MKRKNINKIIKKSLIIPMVFGIISVIYKPIKVEAGSVIRFRELPYWFERVPNDNGVGYRKDIGYIYVSNVDKVPNKLEYMSFPTWTEVKGQDDINTTAFGQRVFREFLHREPTDRIVMNGISEKKWFRTYLDGPEVATGKYLNQLDTIIKLFETPQINNELSNYSNSDFVNAMYRVVLKREPDEQGYRTWLNYTNQYSKIETLRNSWQDTESKDKSINGYDVGNNLVRFTVFFDEYDWNKKYEDFTTHMYAKSYDGNAYMIGGITYRVDFENPELDFSLNTNSLTNENVTIYATGTDLGTGVMRIKLPNGNWVSGEEAIYTVSSNGTYTFQAEDNQKNTITRSITVSNINKTAPTLNVTANTQGYTNGSVILTATANDDIGISSIQRPDGSVITGDRATYTATSNGTYSFKTTDRAGNVATKSITLNNIDREPPSVSLSTNTKVLTNLGVTIRADAFDSGSGIKSIKLPDGNIVNNSTATYVATKNGSYLFEVEDLAGNKISSSITIENIIEIQSVSGINRIEYKLEGATLKDWTTYTSSFSVVNEGITTIKARAIDKAGNTSNEATSFVKIDRSKPINGTVEIIIK